MELYGENISENNKVTNFLRGVTDPNCSVSKRIVLATPVYLQDFTKVALSLVNTFNIFLSNIKAKRNVSGTNTKCFGKNVID